MRKPVYRQTDRQTHTHTQTDSNNPPAHAQWLMMRHVEMELPKSIETRKHLCSKAGSTFGKCFYSLVYIVHVILHKQKPSMY